jgi:archaellum component FlaC
MINFAALEESIQACAEQQTDMSSSLRRLETTVATLASKMEVDQMEHRLKDSLSKTSRSIERLDVEQQAAQQVVQDMPSIQRELTTRMSDLEQRLTADVAKLSQSLGARVSAAEGDLRNKAGKADMSKLKTDIEDCVRRESFDKMQALLNKVRDEASDRLDGIAERTFNMRKELDSSLDQMTATSELLQKRVEERSAALEDQANEVRAARPRELVACAGRREAVVHASATCGLAEWRLSWCWVWAWAGVDLPRQGRASDRLEGL